MTLKEYIEELKKFAEENPETLEMQVITSGDDEGNEYNSVCYTPSKGIFEDGDFIPEEEYEDYDREETETNAVCVN